MIRSRRTVAASGRIPLEGANGAPVAHHNVTCDLDDSRTVSDGDG